MKYEEYIKKLNTEDDSFEVGMLSDLKQKPPVDLHSEIMKSVNKERKRPAYFNYRLYAPLVAAALVIAIVINNHDIVKGTNLLKIFESHNDKTIATNISPESDDKSGDMLKGASDLAQNTDAAANEQNTAGTSTITKATESVGTTAATTNKNTPVKTQDKVAATVPADKSSSDTKAPGSDISGLDGILGVRYETVNYEVLLETPQSSIISFLTNKANCKLVDTNEYKMSTDKFSIFNDLLAGSQINKTLLHKVTDNYVVVKLTAVNYQVIADTNTDDAVKLIKDYSGQYVKNNIYIISKQNYNNLYNAMPKNVYTLKTVNDVYNDYVVIKILPVNYELNLNGISGPITDYIANKDNDQLLIDNIYKFSKDSFGAFDQLLSNAGIVKATVNEATGENVIVKIDKN